jgi:hypothetical protein
MGVGRRIFKLLCGRIKYQSPAHTSLSFFGVMFVLSVALLLIVLSFFELFLAGLLRRWLSGRIAQWDEAENLALLADRQETTNLTEHTKNAKDATQT